MPRQARMHEVGDVHHVMSHGIDSLNIFETELDCTTFLSYLKHYLAKYECRCYGFELMSNHYHLILRPSGDNFSIMMRCINDCFARYINKTRGRRGYVFSNRFKSIPTRDQRYIRQLLLYIHANPLRAGIVDCVEQLEHYQWSSHGCYLHSGPGCYPWVHTAYLKTLVGGTEVYLNVLQDYVAKDADGFDAWVVDEQCKRINDTAPAEVCAEEAQWVREKIRLAAEQRSRRKTLVSKPGIIQDLLIKACEHYRVDPAGVELKSQARQVCKVVQLFCHWAIGQAGFSGVFIGRLLDKSGAAVLRAAAKGAVCAIPVPL